MKNSTISAIFTLIFLILIIVGAFQRNGWVVGSSFILMFLFSAQISKFMEQEEPKRGKK